MFGKTIWKVSYFYGFWKMNDGKVWNPVNQGFYKTFHFSSHCDETESRPNYQKPKKIHKKFNLVSEVLTSYKTQLFSFIFLGFNLQNQITRNIKMYYIFTWKIYKMEKRENSFYFIFSSFFWLYIEPFIIQIIFYSWSARSFNIVQDKKWRLVIYYIFFLIKVNRYKMKLFGGALDSAVSWWVS